MHPVEFDGWTVVHSQGTVFEPKRHMPAIMMLVENADPGAEPGRFTLSAWEMSNDELAEIVRTRRVWLISPLHEEALPVQVMAFRPGRKDYTPSKAFEGDWWRETYPRMDTTTDGRPGK